MGIRVRKLARELKTSPPELLGLLRELGFERYRSADDMVSEVVAGKVRSARRTLGGARPPPPLDVASVPLAARSPPQPEVAKDLMAELVPGVVPVARSGGRSSGTVHPPTSAPSETVSAGNGRSPRAEEGVAPPPAEGALPTTPTSGVVRPETRLTEGPGRAIGRNAIGSEAGALLAERDALVAERAGWGGKQSALLAERDALVSERDALVSERDALVSERDALVSERDALVSERDALVSERDALVYRTEIAAAIPRGPGSLKTVFEERGLRGTDEIERAIAALAQAHALGRVLDSLEVHDVDHLLQVLRDRLVLVGGTAPASLDRAFVVVATDRADVPGEAELHRRCRGLGEQLMLSGLLRVGMVGVAPRWQGIVRAGVDRRVDLTFHASLPPRSPETSSVDAWLVWGDVGGTERPGAGVAATQVGIFEVAAADLASWLVGISSALARTE